MNGWEEIIGDLWETALRGNKYCRLFGTQSWTVVLVIIICVCTHVHMPHEHMKEHTRMSEGQRIYFGSVFSPSTLLSQGLSCFCLRAAYSRLAHAWASRWFSCLCLPSPSRKAGFMGTCHCIKLSIQALNLSPCMTRALPHWAILWPKARLLEQRERMIWPAWECEEGAFSVYYRRDVQDKSLLEKVQKRAMFGESQKRTYVLLWNICQPHFETLKPNPAALLLNSLHFRQG